MGRIFEKILGRIFEKILGRIFEMILGRIFEKILGRIFGRDGSLGFTLPPTNLAGRESRFFEEFSGEFLGEFFGKNFQENFRKDFQENFWEMEALFSPYPQRILLDANPVNFTTTILLFT